MHKLATLLIVTTSAPALAQPAANPQATLEAIMAPLAKADAPGCAVAAAEKGERIATGAFGLADLEHGVANKADSVFEAGSVSKQFTAAAILLLAADGKLSLSDDIRKYLPELPDYGPTITIDHLLSHTSGLRDWGSVVSIAGWERSTRAYTNEDALQVLSRQKALNYQPGAEYSYTNSGYNLMAVIVERVSGQSLAAFSKARLFEPLGMARTQWRDDFRRIVKDHAIAYNPTEAGWQEARPFENVYGNGGLLTTVGDLLIWNEALAADKLGITAKMQVQAKLNDGRQIAYARGVSVKHYHDQLGVSHAGATGGYRAWLERFPERGLSIAVLCNGGSYNPIAIGRSFADIRLPPAKVRTAAGKALVADDARAGLYYSKGTGKPMLVSVENGKLKTQFGPAWEQMADGTFRDDDEGEIRFNGTDGFTMSSWDGEQAFVRAKPFAPNAAALAAFAGRYVSEEAGVAYDVAVEGDGLKIVMVSRPMINAVTEPVYTDTFVDEDTLLRFRRDASGKVNAMSFGVSRVRDLNFVRVKKAE